MRWKSLNYSDLNQSKTRSIDIACSHFGTLFVPLDITGYASRFYLIALCEEIHCFQKTGKWYAPLDWLEITYPDRKDHYLMLRRYAEIAFECNEVRLRFIRKASPMPLRKTA